MVLVKLSELNIIFLSYILINCYHSCWNINAKIIIKLINNKKKINKKEESYNVTLIKQSTSSTISK